MLTDAEILDGLREAFNLAVDPRSASTALDRLRSERVDYPAVFNAIMNAWKADSSSPQAPDCTGLNPSLMTAVEHEKAMIRQQSARKLRPEQNVPFKNPVLGFGPYFGKKLLEVVELDPRYVWTMAESHEGVFWRTQARLAILLAEAQAPIQRDVSPTGYMDG